MKRLTGADRRQAILDETARLMIEKGWHATSTRDVTGRLAVGSGLLHHYFASWKALQLEASVLVFTTEIERIRQACSGLGLQERADTIVDWLVPDADDPFWSLWIDMQGVARTDPEVAEALSQVTVACVRMVTELLSLAPGTPDAGDTAAGSALTLLATALGLAGLALTSRPVLSQAAHAALLNDLASGLVARGPRADPASTEHATDSPGTLPQP